MAPPDSAVLPVLVPMRQVRVSAEWGGTRYLLGSGDPDAA